MTTFPKKEDNITVTLPIKESPKIMTHSAKPNDAIEIIPKRFWSTFWMYCFGSNPKFWIEKWRGQFFLLERLIQRKKDLNSVSVQPFPMDVFSDKRLSKYIDRV